MKTKMTQHTAQFAPSIDGVVSASWQARWWWQITWRAFWLVQSNSM